MKTEIPDFPIIPFKNYYVLLSGKIRISLQNDIVNRIISPETKTIIASRLHIRPQTVTRYILKRKYPLYFLREIESLTDEEIFSDIRKGEPIFLSKWKQVKLPLAFTPKLAYLFGYLQGDGSVESNGKRINFSDEHKQQLEIINMLCKEIFDIDGKIRARRSRLSKKPSYTLEIGSIVVNSFFSDVLGLKRGTKYDLEIPGIILKNEELLKWYICGLFDADGTLPKHPYRCKQLFIDFTMKDKSFVQDIRLALKRFGVETLKPYCRRAKSPNSETISHTWELRIRRRKDIITFLKQIGFFHPDKAKRMKLTLSYLGL